MKVTRSAHFLPLFSALMAWGHFGLGATPLLDQPIPINPPTGAPDETQVPVGKALVIPITAADSDGDRLTFTAKSDRTNVQVRVRTGHPKLKMAISHAGDGGSDAAFTGTLEFAIFRDLTPITAGFMGGFAQAHYFDNQVFHRIADLNPSEDTDGSFIVQGGDPNGSNPSIAGQGGPGFNYDNEFHPGLIFSGKGQLAMANSGFSSAFKGTNGSQFFITAGHPRFLDFNHTIFGQLLRGWDTLAKVTAVPRYTGGSASTPADRPKVDVQITSATLEPDFQDAVLLVSATAPSPLDFAGAYKDATITVTVTDANGGTDTKTFKVRATNDDTNDPPFVRPVPPKLAPLNQIFQIPLTIVDLEHDYVFATNQALSGSVGQAGGSKPALTLSSSPGVVKVGTAVTQYDMTFRNSALDVQRGVDDEIAINVAAGDKRFVAQNVNVAGAPNTALTNVVVATFTAPDASALASGFTAKINWGDGTTPITGTIVRDANSASPNAYAVQGSHLYAQAGTYPVVVDITSANGQLVTVNDVAAITSGTMHAYGRTAAIRGARLLNGIVGTFTDDAALTASSYTATISWGDGTHGNGTVRKGINNDFQVLGSHVFPDPEDYSVVVRIHKNGADAATDVFAWSLVQARGFVKAAHLPPFSAANLIGQFSQHGTTALRKTSRNQTLAAGQLVVVNSGTRSVPASVEFYLSDDTTLNLEDETIPDPSHPGQTIINRKDLPVLIGSANLKRASLGTVVAGAARELIFDYIPGQAGVKVPPGGDNFGLPKSTPTPASDMRLRFPAGETGAGMNLLVHLVYTDALAKNLPIDREIVFGPYDPYIVAPTELTVQEGGATNSTATFKVRLARQPDSDVTIPVTLNAAAQAQVTVDKTSLVFTHDNWMTDQVVTVAAVADGTRDGTKSVTVTLGSATSNDVRFAKMNPTDVTVTVLDAAPFVVTPTALTVREADPSNASKTFSVRLNNKPTANVTIPITISQSTPAQVQVDQTSLTFTTTNWNVDQVVTVTAIDDGVADGTKSVTVSLGRPTTTDSTYFNLDPPDVSVTVQDKAAN